MELSRKEKSQYSVRAAICSLMEHGQSSLSGLEKEVHDELQKEFPQRASGCLVPSALFEMRRNWRRDLNATTFGSGGALIPFEVPESEFVPILRNKLCCQRLGCRVLSGLKGGVGIPRQTGAAAVYSLPEQQAVTKSTQTLDQVVVNPHRVSAETDYSRQLVLQSSLNVESFIRDDLNAQVAVKVDALLLNGVGAGSEPTGVLNTTGIGSVNFGGAATWQEVLSFENALAKVNADQMKLGWITSPNVRNKWKAIAKTGVGVTSVVPIFLWPENSPYNDGSNDGVVNGYRAAATNQVLNDLVFFGNWDDVILAQFGDGLELIVNPYTRASEASVQIVVNSFWDIAVRRAASFCVSGDSGAQ